MSELAQDELPPHFEFWLSRKLNKDVTECSVRHEEKLNRLNVLHFVDAKTKDGSSVALCMKATMKPEDIPEARKKLGLAREAFFYFDLCRKIGMDAHVPKCYFADGDLESGEMLLLLDNIEGSVPAGVFFGPGNPNNWGSKTSPKHSPKNSPPKDGPSPVDLSRQAFELYAKLHATTWCSFSDWPWLRGADWIRGEDEAGWTATQKMASDAWARLSAARAAKTSPLKWDAHLVACCDAAFGKVSWEACRRAAKVCEMRTFEGSVSSAQFPTRVSQARTLGTEVLISPQGLVR